MRNSIAIAALTLLALVACSSDPGDGSGGSDPGEASEALDGGTGPDACASGCALPDGSCGHDLNPSGPGHFCVR